MKNDKKWLKESVNELKTIFNGRKMGEYETGRLDGNSHVSMLIDHLDEPEKPIIPQFVADWIDEFELYGSNPLKVYRDLDIDFNEGWANEEDSLVYHWVNENPYVFVDALRYGYEVEKEPKYYVLDKEGATLLKKSSVSEGIAKSVGTNISSAKSWKDEKKYQLTEQEIKDYDERFWPFAQEVTE